MTQNQTIILAGVAYDVPPLPLRHNRVVYPLCRKLVMADLLQRCIDANGALMAGDEELEDLITIAMHIRQVCDPSVTREDVEASAITPPELLTMFFRVRYLTGAWLPLPDAAIANPAGDETQGEPQGEKTRDRKGPRRPRK